MKKLLSIIGIFLLSASLIYAIDDCKLLRDPDICSTSIVFVYGGDLWIVEREGGNARRLTSHIGLELSPKISPDEKWITFSGQYDGNMDVYIIPLEGGAPKRLTYHPGPDYVVDWTPDSKYIIFNTARNSYHRFFSFFKVSIKGGFPESLPLPMAYLGSYSPDGNHIAYTPLPNAFRTWKRYRGGLAPHIWLFNFKDNSIKKVPHTDANDTYPMWMKDTVYFLSDREGMMNLFAFNTLDEKVTQLTDVKTYDIKSASAGSEVIVYEWAGEIHVYDPSSQKSSKVFINVPSDQINVRPHYEKVETQILNFNLSPSGVRAVFESHGEILTVPSEKGDIRNLTNTPGICDRDPSWSPDGQSLAYFSDATGEYALYIVDQKASKVPTKIEFSEPSFYYSPCWSPDSKKLAFSDKHLNLYYLDLSTKKPVLIDTDTYSNPERSLDPVWSPDSKWITYTKKLINHFRAVHLYSLEKGKSYQITDGMSDAISPVFDPDGKHLYFAASTDSGPTSGWLDLSSYDRRITRSLYVVVLRKDLPSPFAPESDEEKKEEKKAEEEKPEKSESEEKKEVKKEKKKEPEFRVDLENLDQRILSLPVPARDYRLLRTAEDGILFYLESIPNQRRFTLHRFNMKERKAEPFLRGVTTYTVSHDGKKLLYFVRRSPTDIIWGIIKTSGKVKVGDGKLKTEAMEVLVDPKLEWKQMLWETWRINRDFFYDPGMHGVDWPKMYERYATFLLYVSHRSDLNFLIAELIGELVVGHAYVGGGDFPDVEVVPGGLLGADYKIQNGRYCIKKIYSGLNWNPRLRAPLTEPGVNVKEGDYILKVNGRELKSPANIYSLFEKTSGKQVVLTVNSVPEEKGAREVTVVPIANETGLRNRAWVEGNLSRVHELSNGRVGYVYLPNTSVAGYTYFNRYFYAQLEKEALVVDERFNGGGYAADYIIDLLDRPLLSYWATRDGKDFPTPMGSIFGPKVMIINEYAGSGGDALPLYFRRRNIGPIVGKKTWGGLIGIYDYPRLMDGGYVTAPRLAIWSPDGEWEVENVGVPPDAEVEMTPSEVIAGRDPQLEKAVELALKALEKKPLKKPKRPPYPDKSKIK
ncbi:MAG: PDZ domain-containing protein [Candidatus Aminicenantaceae bacterium]